MDLHVEDCDSHRERTFPADDCDPPPVVCGKAQSSSRKYVPDRVGLGFRGSVRVNYESDGALASELGGDVESVKSASRRRAVDRRSLIVRLELW